MNDPFDADLRERLATLARTVPVDTPGSVATVRPRFELGSTGRRQAWGGGVPVLAVLLIGTIAAGLAKVGPFAPGAGLNVGPVSASVTDGQFQLSLLSSRARYAPDEAIDVEAALTYLGPGEIAIRHSQGASIAGGDPRGRGGPISFGILEPVLGGLQLSPGWRESCERTVMTPATPLTIPFGKSGAFSGDDPRAGEYQAYFSDPVLRLVEGTWHLYAVADFAEGACTWQDGSAIAPPRHEMRVEIEIKVDDVPAAVPSASPIELLTATAPQGPECNMAAAAGQLAQHPLSGLGLAHEDGFVSPVRWPHGFTAAQTTEGAVIYDEIGQVFAREGDRVVVGGGWGYIRTPVPTGPGTRDNEIFNVCSPIRLPSTSLATQNPSLPPDGVPKQSSGTPVIEIPLRTVPEPVQGCRAALGGGVLTRHPASGLGITLQDGELVAGLWPFGFTARQEGEITVLVDAEGLVVAREGDSIVFTGYRLNDGTFYACSSIRVGDRT